MENQERDGNPGNHVRDKIMGSRRINVPRSYKKPGNLQKSWYQVVPGCLSASIPSWQKTTYRTCFQIEAKRLLSADQFMRKNIGPDWRHGAALTPQIQNGFVVQKKDQLIRQRSDNQYDDYGSRFISHEIKIRKGQCHSCLAPTKQSWIGKHGGNGLKQNNFCGQNAMNQNWARMATRRRD